MGIEIVLKMLLAGVLGGIVGLEREVSHKEAGLKVNVLIAVGSALLTSLSVELAVAGDSGNLNGNSFQMLAHIITAIGLIGAAIVVRERFTAHGLTTAATVWTVGGVGILVGTGYYIAAFGAAIFIVIGLTALRLLTKSLDKQGRVYAYVISTEDRAAVIIEIKKVVMELGLKYMNATIRKLGDGYEIEMALHTSQTKNKVFVERVMQIPDVKEINSENL
jgi:putative Mg2+ transporter-C (MgtC) family protein